MSVSDSTLYLAQIVFCGVQACAMLIRDNLLFALKLCDLCVGQRLEIRDMVIQFVLKLIRKVKLVVTSRDDGDDGGANNGTGWKAYFENVCAFAAKFADSGS